MGHQLDRLIPFWQPANILHSVLIFMLLWQINIVFVVCVSVRLRENGTAIVIKLLEQTSNGSGITLLNSPRDSTLQ